LTAVGRKFEIRNPKLETIPKLECQNDLNGSFEGSFILDLCLANFCFSLDWVLGQKRDPQA
jgi:hypothetical protein